jgi:hypothetical protein
MFICLCSLKQKFMNVMCAILFFVLISQFVDYFNTLFRWVVIPLWLIVDAYGHIAHSLRLAQASTDKKE